MHLDRRLQQEILNDLAAAYPNLDSGDLTRLGCEHSEKQKVIANLLYLEEHGLIVSGIQRTVNGYESIGAKITAKGLDFLTDDGGLGAILGVVTIRFHEDTIRDLISSKIQDSNLPAPEKKRLIDQLRSLRGEAIKHLTMKLLDKGMENLPAAIPLIQTAISAFQK